MASPKLNVIYVVGVDQDGAILVMSTNVSYSDWQKWLAFEDLDALTADNS